jgi:hypothetical protein
VALKKKGKDMKLFSDGTKAVLAAVGTQVVGSVLGGAVFQVGVRLGNAVVDTGRDLVRAVSGSSDSSAPTA